MDGCGQDGCSRPGIYLPVFVLYFAGGIEPRRIEVPIAVCAEHAARLRMALASPARRRSIERAAGGWDGTTIDWRRCRLELIATGEGAAVTGPADWPS